ncbi:MAG: transposase family protein [Puniceicoccales bacterium]|jgi:tmRNA-binding protein|nr:transposase family protein [Puniceicoccales bacterium]
MDIHKLYSLDASTFRRYFGVLPDTFAEIRDEVQKYMEQKGMLAKKAGRPRKLNVEQALAMTLHGKKEAASLTTLAINFWVSKSTAHRVVVK